MKATITSIELKTPFKFFALSSYALKVAKQLKTTNYIDFKKRGFWKKLKYNTKFKMSANHVNKSPSKMYRTADIITNQNINH